MNPSPGPFALEYNQQFVFFSTSHLMALLVLASIYFLLWYYRTWFKQPHIDQRARWFVGSLLLLQEFSLSVWRWNHGIWEAGTSLPLHLCGMGIILAGILMFKRNYLLYELVYFWGLGGAIQALMTPNIGFYAYPHYRYFQFFTSHGVLIFASLYMTWVGGMRPTFKSIVRVFAITNVYMVLIAGFNLLTDGNYLFICHKPVTGSIIDFMGPWPWYILALEGVAMISFVVYYSPFIIKDQLARMRAR